MRRSGFLYSRRLPLTCDSVTHKVQYGLTQKTEWNCVVFAYLQLVILVRQLWIHTRGFKYFRTEGSFITELCVPRVRYATSTNQQILQSQARVLSDQERTNRAFYAFRRRTSGMHTIFYTTGFSSKHWALFNQSTETFPRWSSKSPNRWCSCFSRIRTNARTGDREFSSDKAEGFGRHVTPLNR